MKHWIESLAARIGAVLKGTGAAWRAYAALNHRYRYGAFD